MPGVIVLIKAESRSSIYYADLSNDGDLRPTTGRFIEEIPNDLYFTPEDRADYWARFYGVPLCKESFMVAKEDRVVLVQIGEGAPGAGRFRLDVNQSRITLSKEGLVALLEQIPDDVWEAYHDKEDVAVSQEPEGDEDDSDDGGDNPDEDPTGD